MPSREEEMARIEVNSQRKSQPQHCKRTKGTGSIEKRVGRQNKYRVKVAIGRVITESGKTVTRYKNIGSYPTKKLAEEALTEYFANPYDLDQRINTFQDLYEAWSEEYCREYPNESSSRSISSAFASTESYDW